MDILENPYYNLIRYIIITTGQSRYHLKWINFCIKSFFLFIMFSFLGAQIAGMIKVLGNIDLVLECIPPVCYVLAATVLFINNNLQEEQINVVFLKMQNDWEVLTSKYDTNILHKFARRCKIYTMIFTFGSFGILTVYLSLNLIPLLIGISKNSPEQKPFVYLLEFGISAEKYYYLITLYSLLGSYIFTSVIINGDTVLLMFLEHACAIFEIIGHKLSTAVSENYNSANKANFEKNLHREIKLCVEMHIKALLFVNDIQSVFSTAYLIVFGFCIIILSITGVQSVMSMNNTRDAIRFGTYTCGQVIHILLVTIPTQHLLDTSVCLSDCIYNADWYHLSGETKKLLLIIMKRGAEPSTFVIGKTFIISLQFFTKVLQTSLSYFTVLMSVRE
ncbi:odorant receptor 49b-like [Leptopilina boulardi]|uniref:odorant receptor 49b-like n=1 Tax=Leptopilina boulardi TaxID=63433 RepID=UPI0021F615F6|nr:odorant receptor 49b-like [Leptopilina boulardi]